MTAIWMAIRVKSLLIGEAADEEVIDDVRQRAGELSAVLAVNDVITLHMGPNFILVNVSVDFRDDVPAGEVENAIERLTREIREAHVDVQRVFIEAERSKNAPA